MPSQEYSRFSKPKAGLLSVCTYIVWPTLWSLEAFLPWDGKNLRPRLLASVRSLPTVETINSRETYSSSVITQPFLGFEAALVRRFLPHQQLGRRVLKGFQQCGVLQTVLHWEGPFMCLSSCLVLGLHVNRPYSVCLKLPEPLKRTCLKLCPFSSGHRDPGRSTLPSDLFHERDDFLLLSMGGVQPSCFAGQLLSEPGRCFQK